MAVVFITLGTRDVSVHKKFVEFDTLENGKEINHKIKGTDIALFKDANTKMLYPSKTRTDGEKMVKKLPFLIKNKIIFLPIIEPILKDIKRKERGKLRIYFVVTDQDKSEIPHYFRDTVYLEEICKERLLFLYKDKVVIEAPIKLEKGVAYLDTMYKKIGNLLNDIKINTQKENVYTIAQTGVPAISIGFLLQSIEKYKKINQFGLAEEKDQEPTELNFPNLFMMNVSLKQIKALIENYDYTAAEKMCKQTSKLVLDKGPQIQIIEKLCQYGARRLSLNFESVKDILKYLKKEDDANRKFYKILSESQAQNSSDFQKELFLSALIKKQRKEYADFLFRMFTLAEEFHKEWVIDYFQASPVLFEPEFKPLRFPEWELILYSPKHRALKTLLEKEQNYLIPNRRTLFDVYKFDLKNRGGSKKTDERYLFFTQLELLAQLRNSVAHQIKGIRADDIYKRLGGSTETKLNNFLVLGKSIFGVDEKNIYDKLNEHLFQEIEKI